MLSENMASLGGEQIISTKDLTDSSTKKESRPSSVEKKIVRDREEKLRLAKERQNEERQRKIEELRAQAEAAQKYREQKEEERRRRIEELRNRDNDRRLQVEERKKAIMEADKERREYILRKNQDREARLNTKHRNEKGSIVFAFGSSTPRLLDPSELGSVSPSTYWGHRRSTSITNVAYTGAPLTRRSSERELTDGPKKRAASAGGIDRQNDDRRRNMSTSIYEVFNWGCTNDERPQRYSLSIAAAEIDIDGPPTNDKLNKSTKEESTDSPPVSYRSVYRRKTDLMPTIPSPRDSSFGSRNSLYSHTPRTPGRAVSMTRLDQLAQPIRRNGEHIRAIIERERQHQYGLTFSQSTSPNTLSQNSPTTTNKSITSNSMSRSMTHLAGNRNAHKQNANDIGSVLRPLRKKDACRSMTQLTTSSRTITTTTTTTATATATTTKKTIGRSSKYDRKDDAPSSLTSTGSRSGDVTPGGSINTSRPGSAMSTSTTASGLVQRRSVPATRKPRPASIAVTGVSLNDEMNKQKKEKPPLPKVQSTPKRAVTSSAPNSAAKSVDNKQTERRSSFKKDSTQKPKALFNSVMENSTSGLATKNTNSAKAAPIEVAEKQKVETEVATTEVTQTKEEKEALNTEKCEISNQSVNVSVVKEAQIVEITSTQSQEITEEKTEEKVDNETEKENKTVQNINETKDVVNVKVDLKEVKEVKAAEIKETPKPTTNEVRELSAERQDNEMTASMIARKITTEEEAKAALAERRRLAREEAERQAELERQRVEAERQAELKRQAEEEERQRKFEEETLRLAEEQRKAEEARLLQAIEEAKKREEVEKLRREEEERLKVEREEAEKKAKEEAEKQRLEVAERLKREEKEREERRKRVEAIMSRTRAKGGNATPNSTPTKDNDSKSTTAPTANKPVEKPTEMQQSLTSSTIEVNENNDKKENSVPNDKVTTAANVSQNPDQNSYEKSVTDKENALINSFTNMIMDDQKQHQPLQQPEQQNVAKMFPNFPNPLAQVTNGKLEEQKNENNDLLVHAIANGNGHADSLNKNATNDLKDLSSATITDQLIDFSESQQITDAVNFNNNNSLLTSATPLVTSDSHENKEISLL